MVITVEIYKQIRKMRLDGMSHPHFAATLPISCKTVKKCWDGDSVPREWKDYSLEPCVLTEDVVAFVRRCREEDCAVIMTQASCHTATVQIEDTVVGQKVFHYLNLLLLIKAYT